MSLSPEYLDGISEPLQKIYSELQSVIQADIARRIAKMGYTSDMAAWQIIKLQELGASQAFIATEIAKTLKISEKEVYSLFKQSGIKSMQTDIATQRELIRLGILPADTIPLTASASFAQVLNANALRTMNTMKKLTGTIALDASGKLNQHMDQCQLMAQSGAYTERDAIDTTVKKFVADGVGTFDYFSGVRTSIEAAVRRACVTGINQATAEVSINNAAELGTNLVEVTSHSDSRPQHAEWQGKVYRLVGSDDKYRNLKSATGYGTVTGLCGANCRHSFHPFVEGVSDKMPREQYDPKTYEAEQEQRYNERQIRYWKRRADTLEAGGVDNSKDLAKVREWQARQREHLKGTGLTRDYAREKTYTKPVQSVELKSYLKNVKPTLPKTAVAANTSLQNTLPFMAGAKSGAIQGLVPSGADIKNVRTIAGYDTSTNIRSVSKLADQRGGEHWKWQKKGGIIETPYRNYDVHWYEYEGKQYETKVKGVREK